MNTAEKIAAWSAIAELDRLAADYGRAHDRIAGVLPGDAGLRLATSRSQLDGAIRDLIAEAHDGRADYVQGAFSAEPSYFRRRYASDADRVIHALQTEEVLAALAHDDACLLGSHEPEVRGLIYAIGGGGIGEGGGEMLRALHVVTRYRFAFSPFRRA